MLNEAAMATVISDLTMAFISFSCGACP